MSSVREVLLSKFEQAFTQWDLLKNLARYLGWKDINNVAYSSVTMYKTILGTEFGHEVLLLQSYCCDGSSGEVWKEAYLNRIENRVGHLTTLLWNTYLDLEDNDEEDGQPNDSLVRALLNHGATCESHPPQRRSAYKLCMGCNKPVCNVCRFHSNYSPFIQSSLPRRPARYLYESQEVMLRDKRFKAYCEVCEVPVTEEAPKHDDGSILQCRCLQSSEDGIWVCVPCVKREYENVKGRSKYVCANRRQPSGCTGCSSGFGSCGGPTLYCIWCKGTQYDTRIVALPDPTLRGSSRGEESRGAPSRGVSSGVSDGLSRGGPHGSPRGGHSRGDFGGAPRGAPRGPYRGASHGYGAPRGAPRGPSRGGSNRGGSHRGRSFRGGSRGGGRYHSFSQNNFPPLP